MKTYPLVPMMLAAAALMPGCSNHDQATQATAGAPTPTADVQVVAVQPTIQQAAPARPQVGPDTPVNLITDTPSPSWDDIKNLTWDQRTDFLAGLAHIEDRLDRQIGALNAKRASMTKDLEAWDFQMKEVNMDRQFLSGLNDELGKASADTWNQEKDKVEQALMQAQDACEKVKSSTTS